MKDYINGIDFHNLTAMKYYAPPSSWSQEKKKELTTTRIFSGDWYGALKKDGAFYKFIKDEDGNMELIGRSKSKKGDYLNKIDWVPHLHSFFEELPNGTCFLGELYLPSNEQAKSTTSIMNCLVDKAIKRQEKEKLHYYIFDCLAWDKESYINMKAIDRFLHLKDCSRAHKGDYYEWAEYYCGEELWEKLQNYLAEGKEGIVITLEDAPYRPGKRPSKETLKVKKELQETLDLVIIGANRPEKIYMGKEIQEWPYWFDELHDEPINKNCYKEYQKGEPFVPVTKNWFNGWAGSLQLGAFKGDKVVHVGNLSGITDEMKANWHDYIGKVVEITAMEVMDTGGVRHPKFLQIREDKDPKDCKLEEIFGK